MDDQVLTTQRTIWSDLVGEAWVRHADVHDQQAQPFGLAVMNALGDLSGARVLDVGCGTGTTTTQLLARGAAEVVGVDLSEPMIAAARSGVGDARVEFELGDVLELVPSDRFDVVFSRFGVMFFADPVAAFRQLRSYGTPESRLGFCSWGPPASNPVMTLPVMASVAVLGPPALAGPGEPGPFSLPEPAVVRPILEAAGWTAVQTADLVLDPPHPARTAAAIADMVMDFNPLLVEGLQRQPELRDATRRAILEAVQRFEREGTVHLGANALIVTARS